MGGCVRGGGGACGRVGVCEGGRVCVSESERQRERRKAFKFSEKFHNQVVEFELSNLLFIEDLYLLIFYKCFVTSAKC